MRLYYANRSRNYLPCGNFGDELNPWLWPKLLPGAFDDEDDGTGFVGIGTILNDKIPQFRNTIVFGAGYGFFNRPTMDETWTVYCVRGPRTAAALGVDSNLGITDPGILVRSFYRPGTMPKSYHYAFMPHVYEVIGSTEPFERVCAELGIRFIDPRWKIEQVLKAIDGAKALMTAAMHGAIAADALRVPWVPVITNAGIPDFKWCDWCESMDLRFEPFRLRRMARLRSWIPGYIRFESFIVRLALQRIIRNGRVTLSTDRTLNRRLEQLKDKVDLLRQDIAAGRY